MLIKWCWKLIQQISFSAPEIGIILNYWSKTTIKKINSLKVLPASLGISLTKTKPSLKKFSTIKIMKNCMHEYEVKILWYDFLKE